MKLWKESLESVRCAFISVSILFRLLLYFLLICFIKFLESLESSATMRFILKPRSPFEGAVCRIEDLELETLEAGWACFLIFYIFFLIFFGGRVGSLSHFLHFWVPYHIKTSLTFSRLWRQGRLAISFTFSSNLYFGNKNRLACFLIYNIYNSISGLSFFSFTFLIL